MHKYFEPRDNGFEIKRKIRKMVIFANHNLVQDAGFTRLDLISCRNVLIYMQGQLQQKVLHGLNFSLRSNGILFLGESETLGNAEGAFTTLHARWRIYRKFRSTNLLNIPRASLQEHWLSSRFSPRATTPSSLDPILEGTLRSLVSRRGGTCLVVDRHNCLIHVAGGSADVLLVPEGRLSNDLAQRVVPSLRLPINTAINRARRSGTEGASYRGIVLREQEPEARTVKLEVWPLAGKEPGMVSSSSCEDLLIVLIETDSTEVSKSETTIPLFEAGQEASHRISEIEYELQQTRENLQATIEELETTNEEQQATNEELIASNEELQSTNEELHSVNEELYTVNSEYESKIQELLQLNSDIDNLLKSTEIGVIFLDKDLAIRKFTPAARAVIKLVNTDVGRSIVDLSHSMVLEDFPALLKSVLASGQPESYEVELQDGRHMLMRLHPYPTNNDEMDGVVISFVEISRLKKTEQDLRHAQQQLTLNNEALERRVADRTRVLERFSHHLRQLHHISTNTYASEAELLQAYLQAGCSIFGLTTGSLICFHSNRLTLKAFCSTVFEQEIGQTFSHEIHCSEALHCPWLPWSQRQKTVGYDTVDSLELNEHPLYAAAGIQSYLATKIQLEAEGFGLLEFGAIAPRLEAFEQHELEILELIAAGMANAMARERTQRTLVAQEAEYRKFYNETPVMLHSVDAMGHLLSVSDYWLEKLGYTRAEVLGRSILDFLTSASQTYAQRVVVPEFLKLGSSLDVPYQMVRQDGQVIDVLLSAIAERDPAGQLHRTLAVLVDVTESRRLQSELQQAQALAKAKETAEVANRAKSRFLASITHELRTPLNSVLGFSELLECDRSLGLEQIKQVETIRRAGKHLLSLINNVLDLSTLEAEQIAPVYSHFDLHWLLEQEIWNLFDQQAATKGLRFEILQDPAVPQYVYTDPVRLRQILINLVGNAIKFTQSGQVSLRVSAIAATCSLDADTPTSGELLRFSIMDTGPGIAHPQLPDLFTTFSPADRVPEGAGLGLSLSYQLAHLLGGELAVESQLGEGSTFTLTLPVQRSDATEGQRAIDFRAVIGLAPGQLSYRILVVDSDLDNQQFLVSLLTQVGFQVQAVRHGTEVLPLWERWQPSLVLIDIQFPNLDGPALVRQLKNTPQGQHTPVIILTASVFEQNQAEIMATGCDHYLKKPVDAAEILSTIQRHLQVTYLYADSNPAAPSGETADESQILSVSRLSQLQTLWLDDFYQALAIGATAQMYQLIDQLPPEQSEVAIALERQISQYRFQTLLELFAPLCEH
ncbi:MAG: response regulator [Synechococcales cyanobacterium CRU_2_2]|nr:response regulator [Synechococcales cyanobacterium CRU_2_2]